MNRLERTKNTVRNLIWGFLNKVVTLLLPFLIRTMIVDVLGKRYLGLNNLFSSVLNVLNLAELGIGSAMSYAMYRPIAEGDETVICSLLNLYKKIYRIIGAVIAVIGVFLIPFLPFLVKGSIGGINIYVLYLIFLSDTIFSYLMYAYKSSLLSAHQRTDVISNIGTGIQTLLNVTQIILLFLFKNYYIYILMKPVFTIGNNIVINIVTNRMYPKYRAKGKVPDTAVKEIFEKVKALIGHKIGGTIIGSADSLVISAFLGLDILAIYSNYYYIIFFLVSVTSIFFGGMLAGIGNSLVVETKEHNYKLFNNISFMTCWLVAWCSTCLLCLLQPFMRLWMGEDMLLPAASVIYIVVYYYTWQFRTAELFFKDAAGMWQEDFWKPYVAALINLCANIILVNIIGINGVFISTIACMVGVYFPWETIVIFKKLFQRSPKQYLKDQMLYFIRAIMMCGMTFGICEILPVNGMLELIIRFLICVFVPNIFWIMTSINSPELKYLLDKGWNFVRKRTSV